MVADFAMAIVDGTGDIDKGSYERAMQNSFCKQLEGQLGDRANYRRGPSFDGFKTAEAGREAAQFLIDKSNGGRTRLILAGYSRGGSAAIMAAEILQTQGHKVHSMFLFDPVARHMSSGGEVIPANVEYVCIARRSLTRGMIDKYDHSVAPVQRLPDPELMAGIMATGTLGLIAAGSLIAAHYFNHNPMRVWFGGTGKSYLGNPANLHEESFIGTHGAIGGVGWPHVEEDEPCQKMVAAYMTRAMQQRDIPAQLISYRPR